MIYLLVLIYSAQINLLVLGLILSEIAIILPKISTNYHQIKLTTSKLGSAQINIITYFIWFW